MKKLRYIFLLILLMPSVVYAAGSSISVNGTVENGSNITATLVLSDIAAWDVEFRGSGNTDGCYTHEADVTSLGNNTTKRISITCRANAEGSITFKATGDMTSANGNTVGVNTSKTVTVVKKRNGNNNLSGIKLSNGSINFNPGTTDYRVVVDNSVSSITISATAQEGTSKVENAGVKNLNVYDNYITINCRAENGSVKSYNINVVRRDENGNDHVLSENNNLTGITVEGYNLIFREDVKEYTLLVKSKDLLNVAATAQDGTAKVNVKNVEQMINGNNVITIEVAAESGKTQEYIINAILLDETAKCECPKPKCDNKKWFIIIGVLAGLLLIVVIALICVLVKNRNKDSKEEKKSKKSKKKTKEKEEETE